MSISAQSQASVPPAPAWIVTKALQWSLGPLSIDCSSNASKSLLSLLRGRRGCRRRTRRRRPPRPARSRPARSSPWPTRASNGLMTPLSVFSSAMTALALSWSFQNVGPSISAWRLVAAGLLFAEVKESLVGGRSDRSRSWPIASARHPSALHSSLQDEIKTFAAVALARPGGRPARFDDPLKPIARTATSPVDRPAGRAPHGPDPDHELFDPHRTPVVGRLAPSPTGGLHLGHARTFLIAWLAARRPADG